jgi:simple sugar transport system permease protein
MVSLLTSAIGFMPFFLFGCTGEIITEKSGHLNLGIPGIICAGGAGGSLGASLYMSALNGAAPNYLLLILISVVCAFVVAALLGGIYAFLTVSLKCNQNISGLALTTFGTGLTQFIMKNFVNIDLISAASTLFKNNLPFASSLGWFGQIFLSHGILIYLSVAISVAAAIVIKRTKLGLRLRAVGENPAAADAVGIKVDLYKNVSILIGSGIAGLAGCFFILDYIQGGYDSYYIMESLGWLAIALVIFTLWRPNLAIIGSIIFGALFILPNVNIMAAITANTALKKVIEIIPYIFTVLVLLGISISGSKLAQPPASLGVNYFREER